MLRLVMTVQLIGENLDTFIEWSKQVLVYKYYFHLFIVDIIEVIFLRTLY